jgi:hypothetical protein
MRAKGLRLAAAPSKRQSQMGWRRVGGRGVRRRQGEDEERQREEPITRARASFVFPASLFTRANFLPSSSTSPYRFLFGLPPPLSPSLSRSLPLSLSLSFYPSLSTFLFLSSFLFFLLFRYQSTLAQTHRSHSPYL